MLMFSESHNGFPSYIYSNHGELEADRLVVMHVLVEALNSMGCDWQARSSTHYKRHRGLVCSPDVRDFLSTPPTASAWHLSLLRPCPNSICVSVFFLSSSLLLGRTQDILYLPSLWYHRVSQRGITVAVNYWHDMQFDHKYVHYRFLQTLAAKLREKGAVRRPGGVGGGGGGESSRRPSESQEEQGASGRGGEQERVEQDR